MTESEFQKLKQIDESIEILRSQAGETRVIISHFVKYRSKFESYCELLEFVQSKFRDRYELWDRLMFHCES